VLELARYRTYLAGPGALTSARRFGKRPDARRLPDDTRRAAQPNRELQAFGTAESNLCELRGRKPANRRALLVRMHPGATKPFFVADEAALKQRRSSFAVDQISELGCGVLIMFVPA
jgi:hypothetical protein